MNEEEKKKNPASDELLEDELVAKKEPTEDLRSLLENDKDLLEDEEDLAKDRASDKKEEKKKSNIDSESSLGKTMGALFFLGGPTGMAASAIIGLIGFAIAKRRENKKDEKEELYKKSDDDNKQEVNHQDDDDNKTTHGGDRDEMPLGGNVQSLKVEKSHKHSPQKGLPQLCANDLPDKAPNIPSLSPLEMNKEREAGLASHLK